MSVESSLPTITAILNAVGFLSFLKTMGETFWRRFLKAPTHKRQPGQKRRGIYLLPNLLTTGALFAGFYAIVASIKGSFEAAALATLAAMVLDFADGRVARYTHTESEFGAEYDSLSDVVSFGVAPGLMAFMYAISNLGQLGWVVTFVYLACTALRLARFNTGTTSEYFTGLASPAGAGLVASSVWLSAGLTGPGPTDSITIGIVLSLVVLASGLLMVSNFAYVSPKAVRLGDRVPFTVLVAIALVFALVLLDPPLVLLGLFGAYAASGPVQRILGKRESQGKGDVEEEHEDQEEDQDEAPDSNLTPEHQQDDSVVQQVAPPKGETK